MSVTPAPSSSATTSLPTELWAIIFDLAISVPIFFDAKWDKGIITPFDESYHPLSPQDYYEVSLVTKKAILLVCKSWNAIARGIVFRQIVVRRKDTLDSLVNLLEADALGILSGGVPRVPLGWLVTHVKLLITANDAINRMEATNLARRLVACCPRLVSLQDAAPYGLREPPLEYILNYSSPARPKQLRSLIWSYGGPRTEDFESDSSALKQIYTLQCTTIHLPSSPAYLDSFMPITLPNLKLLDLSISWNNHISWQYAAKRLSFPSLQHLTIRAPAPGDGALTPESVRSLEAFLDAHGQTLRSLDVRISPRATAWLFRDRNAVDNVLDIAAILARCPNPVDIALSACWLSTDDSISTPAAVGGQGEDSEIRPLRWQHAKLERVGLRDIGVKSSGAGAGLGSEARSLVSGSAGTISRLRDRALEMSAAYQSPAYYFGLSTETILQCGFFLGTSKRHQPLDATMHALLGTRGGPNSSPPAAKERGEALFLALRTIRLLEARLDSLMADHGGPTEDGVFWGKWNSVAGLRGILIEDCCGLPIVN